MTVHLPGPQILPEEAGPVGRGQLLPQSRRHRAQPVHARAPVAAGTAARGKVAPHIPAQRVQTARTVETRWLGRRGPGRQVLLGEEPVAGHRVHDATRPGQGDRHVRHGQTRADQQEVPVLGYGAECAGRPRIGDVAVGPPQRRTGPVLAGGEVAESEHRRGRPELTAVGELQRQPGSLSARADHPVADPVQTAPSAAGDGVLQHPNQVPAVLLTGDEVTGSAGEAFLGEPAQEVLGVVGEGAHPAGGHIEQVAWVGRPVGGARAGLFGRVDQPDLQRPAEPLRLAHQLHRRQRSCRAGPDDGDMTRGQIPAHDSTPCFT